MIQPKLFEVVPADDYLYGWDDLRNQEISDYMFLVFGLDGGRSFNVRLDPFRKNDTGVIKSTLTKSDFSHSFSHL